MYGQKVGLKMRVFGLYFYFLSQLFKTIYIEVIRKTPHSIIGYIIKEKIWKKGCLKILVQETYKKAEFLLTTVVIQLKKLYRGKGMLLLLEVVIIIIRGESMLLLQILWNSNNLKIIHINFKYLSSHSFGS